MICPIDNQSAIAPVSYHVQYGDTYYKISRYYNITIDDLINANPDVDPDKLAAGDELFIPLAEQKVSCAVGSESYTIQQGDTLYSLAHKFQIKANALIKANHRINPDALLPGQIICIPKPWNSYTNSFYRIELTYPTRWAMVNKLHYEGLDGFFRIEGLYSESSLEELSKSEAYHKLKPYGSKPTLIQTTADSKNAYMVLPSLDQPMEMKKQAAIIFEYLLPITVNGKTYSHLILYADYEHIEPIKKSIKISDSCRLD